MIIDAEDAVFGRLCSFAAKKALEGNEVVIVNSEKIIITGNKDNVIAKYRKRKARGGASQKGPNYPKSPFMIVKRAIRGMLPDYRRGDSKKAFLRIRCYEGFPKEFQGKETIKIKGSNSGQFIVLKELSEKI